MGEVKAQTAWMNQRAALLYVRPQHLAQGMVHEVGGRMVFGGCAATLNIDFRKHRSRPRGWRSS